MHFENWTNTLYNWGKWAFQLAQTEFSVCPWYPPSDICSHTTISPPLSATNLIWHIDKCVEHFGKIRSTRETNQVPWSAALLCHTCLGCSSEWWVPREDLPKSPPLRSSSGLQLRVRAPGSSSSPTTGKQTGPTVNSGRYLSAKNSEERFEGFSLQNWIEKGKLKNRKHSNMFLLRCKAGIMVFGILRAWYRKATFDFICYEVLFRSKRTKRTYNMQIEFFKVFKMADFGFIHADRFWPTILFLFMIFVYIFFKKQNTWKIRFPLKIQL